MYGLFHGLLFLPVVLSLIGPAPFPVVHSVTEVALTADELEPQLMNNREKSEALDVLKEEEVAIKNSTEKECNL